MTQDKFNGTLQQFTLRDDSSYVASGCTAILSGIFFAGFRVAQIIRQEASLNIVSKVTAFAKSAASWEDKNVLALRNLSI